MSDETVTSEWKLSSGDIGIPYEPGCITRDCGDGAYEVCLFAPVVESLDEQERPRILTAKFHVSVEDAIEAIPEMNELLGITAEELREEPSDVLVCDYVEYVLSPADGADIDGNPYGNDYIRNVDDVIAWMHDIGAGDLVYKDPCIIGIPHVETVDGTKYVTGEISVTGVSHAFDYNVESGEIDVYGEMVPGWVTGSCYERPLPRDWGSHTMAQIDSVIRASVDKTLERGRSQR